MSVSVFGSIIDNIGILLHSLFNKNEADYSESIKKTELPLSILGIFLAHKK